MLPANTKVIFIYLQNYKWRNLYSLGKPLLSRQDVSSQFLDGYKYYFKCTLLCQEKRDIRVATLMGVLADVVAMLNYMKFTSNIVSKHVRN